MIDVRALRNDPAAVRAALARRKQPEVLTALDQAIALDEKMRNLTNKRDQIRQEINEVSKSVGHLRRDGANADAESAMARSRELGESEKQITSDHAEIEAQLHELLLRIPNLPHADAPDGASDADNLLIKGPIGVLDIYPEYKRVPHWETGKELGILDLERATKIAGTMFTMQRGLGATMARALCQLALDTNADSFEEVRPPSLVLTSTLTATGHLPKFADDAFAIERDDLWCIPTAEVPLTSLHAGEILDAELLPLKYMAYTPCFRREAGSAGRDTRGMLRTHEFDKVEILAIAEPTQAVEMLDELVARAERLMQLLELPYRIIEICTGDMGLQHHRSFDIEVYAPGCDMWLEVSSVSWFSDYQARRAGIRFKRAGTKGTEIVNTLNGSALAVPRVWAAILENHRNEDGTVNIPAALHPYMRGATMIGKR